MPGSIAGYNAEARKGKDAATKYCQAWQADITKTTAALAAELASKKIDTAVYNIRRSALNKQTKELNDCIASLKRQS